MMEEREMKSLVTGTLILAVAAAASAGAKKGGASKAAQIAEGRTVFEANCAACHGPSGMGDGPAAAALDPKPRNLTDAAYMKTRSEAALRKVIAEGGQSSGLSPVMVGWQGTLTPAQIDAVLAYVQSLGKGTSAGKKAVK
jgi:mono/diheme cytochrome c family protein